MTERKEETRTAGGHGRGRGGFGGGGPWGLAMPTQKARNFKGTLRRLMHYFRPYRLQLALAAAATLISTAASIYTPKLIGDVTTDLFKNFELRLHGVAAVSYSAVLHLLFILCGLYVLGAALNYVQQYVMADVAQSAVYGLRRDVAEKLQRLPMRYFDSHAHGDVLSRFVNDFDNISSTLQQNITQFLRAAITFIGVIIMMLTISPLMTLAVVVTLPLSFLVTKAIAKRSQAHFVSRQRRLGDLNGHIEEMYTGHLVVKAFGHEPQTLQTFDGINEELYESSWRAQFTTGLIMPLMNFIGNIGYVFVSVIGGILVINRQIQIGDILAFIQYARQFNQPIMQLSSVSNVIQSTIASAERVFEILDEEEESPDVADEFKPRAGAVGFEHVDFGYDAAAPIIAGMNLDVHPGQTIAIVGPTGAGKSTLINLMMRFYDVDEGAITVDGRRIGNMRRGDLRRTFGMVLQDTWLFHGTIAENIAYGREGATQAEIVAAAKAAQADHFIRTLPDGYDTLLDEEASNLSAGQKQLLTIARAVLADPLILILDEATSSVDTRTELLIQNGMEQLMHGRTSFVIAHRLSTIHDADLILVMDHGRIVERGRHQELLQKGGFYADLYSSQFKRQEAQREVV